MSRAAILRRPLSLAVAVGAVFAALPGVASATTCTAPALAQVYSWAQDTNWYAAVPNESWDSLSKGWTLSGGAKYLSTTMADGKKGTLLYMPSGSKAISPSTCVTNDYPFGRTEVRNLAGSQGVSVSVAYMGTKSWGPAQPSGTVTGVGTGWTLPTPFNINPSNITGWQVAHFTLTAQGSGSIYEISNFYVDPRMHR